MVQAVMLHAGTAYHRAYDTLTLRHISVEDDGTNVTPFFSICSLRETYLHHFDFWNVSRMVSQAWARQSIDIAASNASMH